MAQMIRVWERRVERYATVAAFAKALPDFNCWNIEAFSVSGEVIAVFCRQVQGEPGKESK